MRRRKRNVRAISRRRGRVRSGRVETVNSTVVGEGRRMRRWGWVVSISALYGCVVALLSSLNRAVPCS